MKTKKILLTVMMLILMIFVVPVKVHAEGFSFPTWTDMQSSAGSFLDKGKGNQKIDTGSMKNVFGPMASIMLGIGIFVLVGVTIVMGIKYVFATPEEAAKLKQQLIGLVVSAVVIFGAVGIWTLAYTVFSSMF